MIKREQIEQCIRIAKQFGAKKLILFGSAADNLSTARDIDLLCDGVDGIDFMKMSAQMEEETGALIDVVPASPENRFVRFVSARGRVLYAA